MVDRFAKEDFLYDLSPSRIEKWMSIFYQTSEIVCNRDVNSVLEVGGGRNLNREICKYFGVEHQVCDVISDYNPDFVCNFLDFTPVEPFDLVCAFQMLEHNPLEDLPVLLKKMVKLSKKYVFISVPYNGAMFSINISFAKNIASLHSSPVCIESIFLIPVVFTAISDITTFTLVLICFLISS